MTEISSSQRFLLAARELGTTRWASFTRVCCVPFLFDGIERVFASDRDPVTGIDELVDKLTNFLKAASDNGINHLGTTSERMMFDHPATEEITGEHYGKLFNGFSEASFWDEPVALLRTRLSRNNIDISNLSDQEVLDAGCGGGRYTVAWKSLGAARAVGIDISPIGIANARQRVIKAGVAGVNFQMGNVLDLPFPDNHFDIVFSNGVLHHTVDWEKGVAEMIRVLKPGGMGWLYLIENPGGLYWHVIELMRELMKDEDRESARISLRMLGLPGNRIFYMLDHVMAPINLRTTPNQVEQCLASSGAAKVRRLERGADFDRIEKIYQGAPYARLKYGVGENRYIFTK